MTGSLSPKMRILLGAVTTMVFLGSGATMLGGGSTAGGAVLVGLGLYRGFMWMRELRWMLADDDEDES